MKDRQQDLSQWSEGTLGYNLDLLKAKEQELDRDIAKIDRELDILWKQKALLQEQRSDVLSRQSLISNEIEIRKEAREKRILENQIVSQLIKDRQLARKSTDFISQGFASVLNLMINDSRFQVGFPSIVEDNLEAYPKGKNESRVSVNAGNNSCRLILTKDGVHAVVYYPKGNEEKIWDSAMNQQLQSYKENIWEVAHGMFYKIDLSGREAKVIPGFMVKTQKRGKDLADFVEANKNIVSSLQPFQNTVVNILQQGDIVLPKKLGPHAIKRFP